jgi:hypothetical protein
VDNTLLARCQIPQPSACEEAFVLDRTSTVPPEGVNSGPSLNLLDKDAREDMVQSSQSLLSPSLRKATVTERDWRTHVGRSDQSQLAGAATIPSRPASTTRARVLKSATPTTRPAMLLETQLGIKTSSMMWITPLRHHYQR